MSVVEQIKVWRDEAAKRQFAEGDFWVPPDSAVGEERAYSKVLALLDGEEAVAGDWVWHKEVGVHRRGICSYHGAGFQCLPVRVLVLQGESDDGG